MAQGSREDAIRSIINFWLKDPQLSCGHCGANVSAEHLVVLPNGQLGYQCCENVCIGDNKAHFEQFQRELREVRETRKNKFASNDKKNMRLALQFPPGLLLFLEKSMKKLYKEELFNDNHDVAWFSRKFKREFSVPEVL